MMSAHCKTEWTSSWKGSGPQNLQFLGGLNGNRREEHGLTVSMLKVRCNPFNWKRQLLWQPQSLATTSAHSNGFFYASSVLARYGQTKSWRQSLESTRPAQQPETTFSWTKCQKYLSKCPETPRSVPDAAIKLYLCTTSGNDLSMN